MFSTVNSIPNIGKSVCALLYFDHLLLIETYKSFFSLPLGLSTESNLYILQRASHAKKWKGLIANNGNLVFDGLTIVVALEDAEGEKKW